MPEPDSEDVYTNVASLKHRRARRKIDLAGGIRATDVEARRTADWKRQVRARQRLADRGRI
jgi:hypothetical protein